MSSHSSPRTDASSPTSTTTLPIVEEQLDIAKRVEDIGGLRVRIEVEDRVQHHVLDTTSEEVSFERIAVGREVDEMRAPWQDGDVLVVPVYEEVVVLERRLLLKEEIRVSKQRLQHATPLQPTVRRERAVVEREDADGRWRAIDASE